MSNVTVQAALKHKSNNINIKLKTAIGKYVLYSDGSIADGFEAKIDKCCFYGLNKTDSVFSIVESCGRVEVLMHKVNIIPLSYIYFREVGAFKRWILIKLLGGIS